MADTIYSKMERKSEKMNAYLKQGIALVRGGVGGMVVKKERDKRKVEYDEQRRRRGPGSPEEELRRENDIRKGISRLGTEEVKRKERPS